MMRKTSKTGQRTQTEEQFRLVVEASPNAMLLINPEGQIHLVNKQAEVLFGYTRLELLNQPVEMLVPPQLRAHHEGYRDAFFAAPSSRPMGAGRDLFGVRKDGSLVPVEIGLTPITTSMGSFTLASIIDITARKQAEEALRLSEERFAKAFRASPDGIVISRVSDGQITEVNDRWCSLFGYNREEVIGRTPLDLTIYVNPADRQLFLSQLETTGSVRDLELALRLKSGEVRQMNVSSERLIIAGEACILSLTRDITERKRMEAALAEERNLLRTLIDNLPDSIYIKDTAGRHLLANRAAVQGTNYTLEQMLGKTDLELYPSEIASRWYADDMAIIQSGEPLINQEEPSFDETGRIGWDLSTKVPFYDAHGNVIGLVGITRDITERKQAEEKLKQTLVELARSNTELEQFAYIASHDLQEPLRMVASYTQLLARRYKSKLDADADEFITFAVEGATRMQQLLKDLLAYSRVNTEHRTPQPTDSEKVLKQALANLQIAMAESKAIITYEALPTVLVDETQLLQLFQNLIANALKFRTEQPPQVHISAEPQGQEWQFSVRDNGIGLEPRYAERIFIIFQRLHSRREYPGTGIGLAICKRIVDRHGGRIWVESQPGQGTTFYFTLPAVINKHSGE